MHQTVDEKRGNGRDQQHDAHHCTHLKVLLTDDLLVNINCQYVELTTDHFRRAEIGNDQGKDDKRCGNQTVARAG